MRLLWHAGWLREVERHPGVALALSRAADVVVQEAQAGIPEDTRAGRASLHKEPFAQGGEVGWKVGWDAEHDYLRFPEFGTEHQPPQPFLRPAAYAVGRPRYRR